MSDFAGILVTGGLRTDVESKQPHEQTAAVYIPRVETETTSHCYLPTSLQHKSPNRAAHSQTGLLACGGYLSLRDLPSLETDNRTAVTCERYTEGRGWEQERLQRLLRL